MKLKKRIDEKRMSFREQEEIRDKRKSNRGKQISLSEATK